MNNTRSDVAAVQQKWKTSFFWKLSIFIFGKSGLNSGNEQARSVETGKVVVYVIHVPQNISL